MNPEDFAERIHRMHTNLTATLAEIDSKYACGEPRKQMHVQIKVILFDDHWMGEIAPSLIKFPFGEVIMTHSFSADDLDALLDKMERYTVQQLENTRNGLIDSIGV